MFAKFRKPDSLKAETPAPEVPADPAAKPGLMRPAHPRPAEAAPQDKDRKRKERLQEVKLEIHKALLDNLNLSLAVRREEFSGGLGDTVYKVSGKWDVWGPISVRGSYGTNYQAPPVGLSPGRVTNGVVNYALAGNQWLPSVTVTRSGVVPAQGRHASRQELQVHPVQRRHVDDPVP